MKMKLNYLEIGTGFGQNNFKKKIYFNRTSGFYNALTGKSSWYRPNLND